MAYHLTSIQLTNLNCVDMMVQNASLPTVFNYFEVVTDCLGNDMVVKILDAHGRIAKTIKQSLEEKVDKVRLNVDDLRRGKYTINIFTDDHFIKAVRYTKM